MNEMNQGLILQKHTLKNRLVMPPMATSCCDEEGHVSEKLLKYYDEKTRGGYISMVITEHSYVSKEGMANKGQLSVSKDSDIDGLQKLADVIHQNGTKAVAQISHAGAAAKQSVTGLPSVAPSKELSLRGLSADREATEKDIHVLVENFAAAARRVAAAGFDGVEIHSAHRYLLNQFYSPLANKREDAYGGSIEGRIHLHLEVIHAVREAIGSQKLLLLRLGALDYMDGGSTMEDALYAAKEFEKAGIDILDVSGGMNGYIIPGKEKEQGYFVDVTSALKKEIQIPVIMTGGITEIEAADRIIADGSADLVGVGRAIFKDSKWAEKALNRI